VRETTLDDPPLATESRTVLGLTLSDDWLDAPGPQPSAVLVVVIAAVGEQLAGLLARPPWLALDRAGIQIVKQWQQLGDVVAVAAGQRDGQRDARCVDEQMVLGARARTING
jgi:hypothetical protein